MRDPRSTVLMITCTAAVFAACGGGGSTAPPDLLVIAVFAGNGQTAIVGQAVAIPPAVRVTNHLGLPLFGVTIKFVVATGNGVVDGDTRTTDSSGIAHPRSWTLSAVAKVDSLEARAVTSTGGAIGAEPVRFTATAIAAAGDMGHWIMDRGNVPLSNVQYPISPVPSSLRAAILSGRPRLTPGRKARRIDPPREGHDVRIRGAGP